MHLAVRANFEEKAAYVARRLADMTVDEQNGFLSVDCGLPSDTFNVIVVRDVSAPIQALTAHFLTRSFPFAVWYWQHDEESVIAKLFQAGLVQTETHSAMYADLSQAQPVALTAPPVAGLEIRQATTANDLLQFGEVVSDFGSSREGRQVLAYFQRLSTCAPEMFPALRYYLAALHGKVVATGTLFSGTQTAGIYDLVTLADYRRRGIGSCMFQHLLTEARAANQHICVLQASKDGLGLYSKAGFSVTGDVLTFERGEVLAIDIV